MKLYLYYQNNPGGHTDQTGFLWDYMIVEAPRARMADVMLEEAGGYFNGVRSGIDCECCGNRWSSKAERRDEPDMEELDIPEYHYPYDYDESKQGDEIYAKYISWNGDVFEYRYNKTLTKIGNIWE